MRLSKFISIILHPIFMPIIALYLSLKLTPSIGFTITNSLNFIKKSLLYNKNLVTLSLSILLHELYTDALAFREIENEMTQSTKVGILCLTSKNFNDNEIFFNKLLINEFINFGKKK